MIRLLSKVRYAAVMVLAAIAMTSCGDSARFEISGRVKDAGSRTLMFVYSDGEKVFSESTTMKEGMFTFFGTSQLPTIVEIQNSSRMMIGRLIIQNGESVECVLNINDPYDITLKGNEPSEQWAEFIRTNSKTLRSGDKAKINVLVEKYVKSHPSSMTSTALMLTCYNSIDNEPTTLKLFEAIDVEARPSSLSAGYYAMLERVADKAVKAEVRSFNLPGIGGKVVHFNASLSPRSLLCFTDRDTRRDSVADNLREIYKAQTDQRRQRLVEISFDLDSLLWRRYVQVDSTKWDKCWAAGAASNPAVVNLAIPRLPYFIVADSSGAQIYRGTSISAARLMLGK